MARVYSLPSGRRPGLPAAPPSRRPSGLLWLLLFFPPLGPALFVSGCIGAPDPLPSRPAAVAGVDLFGVYGVPVALDGSASSSPNSDTLTYTWSFDLKPEGSALTDSAFSPNASSDAALTAFTPDHSGRFVVRLLVDDGVAVSEGDFVVIDVEGGPQPPVAEAGPDQTVTEGMAVYLDGTGSIDPEGDALYYRWSLAGTPSLSQLTDADLVNRYTPYPTLIVDAGGVFTLSLVVSDGVTESAPDYVFVTAEPDNSAPVADAGGDQIVEACTWIDLDGSSSYDLDDDPLEYSWSVLISPLYSSVATASLTDATQPVARLYADREGDYVMQLEVFDGVVRSVPDVVKLTAAERSYNADPTAYAGPDLKVSAVVTCSGAGSSASCPDCPVLSVNVSGEGTTDPDGDPLSYAWSAAGGSDVVIQAPDQLATSVELHGATTEPGATTPTAYTLTLSATDCPGATATDTMVIEYACQGTN